MNQDFHEHSQLIPVHLIGCDGQDHGDDDPVPLRRADRHGRPAHRVLRGRVQGVHQGVGRRPQEALACK